MLPAKVTHAVLGFAEGAMGRTLPFSPTLRGYTSFSKTVVVAKTASVPAAINAGPTKGAAALVQGHDSHERRRAHAWPRMEVRTQGQQRGDCRGGK